MEIQTTIQSTAGWREYYYHLLAHVVCDERFDYGIGLLILANAVILGIQTEFSARSARGQAPEPHIFGVLSTAFCTIFALELALRILVHRRDFFTGLAWQWNVLDLGIIVLQLAEEILSFAAEQQSRSGLLILRILRGVRLIRIVRIVRFMHLLRELRSMVGSIVCTFRSLLWTVILLLLVVYMVGIYLTQLVSDYGHDHPQDVAEGSSLYTYYGSIGRSVLTLFMSISGGIDWHVACEPLMIHVSPVLGFVYSCFIAFTMFSMLNVITGIFVESALKNSKEEMDTDMVSYLNSVFTTPDLRTPGRITLPEFQQKLGDHNMKAYFKSIDLDLSEAKFLFELLDMNGTGCIDARDFVMGCLRLRGPAKAIDMATLMSETRRLKLQMFAHAAAIEDLLGSPGPPLGRTLSPKPATEGSRSPENTAATPEVTPVGIAGAGSTGMSWARYHLLEAETGGLFARARTDSDQDEGPGVPPPPPTAKRRASFCL